MQLARLHPFSCTAHFVLPCAFLWQPLSALRLQPRRFAIPTCNRSISIYPARVMDGLTSQTRPGFPPVDLYQAIRKPLLVPKGVSENCRRRREESQNLLISCANQRLLTSSLTIRRSFKRRSRTEPNHITLRRAAGQRVALGLKAK